MSVEQPKIKQQMAQSTSRFRTICTHFLLNLCELQLPITYGAQSTLKMAALIYVAQIQKQTSILEYFLNFVYVSLNVKVI